MAKRKVPGLNSSSTADISFILLIFFLVTTSMDTDTGLLVRLPALDEDKLEESTQIGKRNILEVLVNAQNRVLIKSARHGEKEIFEMEELTAIAKEFIKSDPNATDLPVMGYRKGVPPPFDKDLVVMKHLICLQTDENTSYDKYFETSNALYRAYSELRNELALERLDCPYESCTKEQMSAINTYYQRMISESEPKDYSKQ